MLEIINKFELKSLYYVGNIKADGSYILQKGSSIKMNISENDKNEYGVEVKYLTNEKFLDGINIFCH